MERSGNASNIDSLPENLQGPALDRDSFDVI